MYIYCITYLGLRQVRFTISSNEDVKWSIVPVSLFGDDDETDETPSRTTTRSVRRRTKDLWG